MAQQTQTQRRGNGNGEDQPTVVEQSVQAMRNRVQELQPMYDEFVQAQHILALIDHDGQEPEVPAPAPQGESGSPAPAQPRTNGRRRRRTNGPRREDQFLEVVRENPGITVAEVGEKLGMKQKNYLYRIKANLMESGQITEQGKGVAVAS